jgi:hypothetical protein
MAKRHTLGLLATAGMAAALAFNAGAAVAQPNLVPLLNTPMNGSVGVQNTGTTAAGPSHLTINCTKSGQADGGCPDAPGMAAYVNPAYPNRVVIDVPALEPGQSFNHNIAFWGAIPWTAGTYIFQARADAGGVVAESNERDNAAQSSYTQRPAVGVAPPQPLPLAAQPAAAEPVKPQLNSTNIFQLKQDRPQRLPRRTPAN